MNRQVHIGGTYHHFKGFIAKVITIATHTETGETLVVYECAGYGINSDHKDGIYARPIEMFLSKVDRAKYPEASQEYRFELIEEAISIVDGIPASDVVEVVRCKDCKFSGYCGIEEFGCTEPNDYCSKGKRKELDNGKI